MSVIDLIERVDAICRRYEKYDLDNHNEALGSQYDVVEAGIEASLQVSLRICMSKSSVLNGQLCVCVFFFEVSNSICLVVEKKEKKRKEHHPITRNSSIRLQFDGGCCLINAWLKNQKHSRLIFMHFLRKQPEHFPSKSTN